MIDVDMITSRREELVEDLTKVRLKQDEIEKAKLENVALQNALTGAIQQCDDFLNKLNNETSDEGDAFIPSIAFPQMQLSRGLGESKWLIRKLQH